VEVTLRPGSGNPTAPSRGGGIAPGRMLAVCGGGGSVRPVAGDRGAVEGNGGPPGAGWSEPVTVVPEVCRK